MIYYLGLGSKYPILRTIGEIYYYGIIIGVIVVFLILAARRMLAMGYPKKHVVIFTVLSILLSFPVGYLTSRGATMFYKPFDQWSISFFIDNMLHSGTHTFHASIIGPLMMGAIFCYIMRMRFFEVFDSIYLYLPLAHAFGRTGCLLIGCCWGNKCDLNLYGLHLIFQNPTPLYAIFSNTAIFLFMRRMYTNIYSDPWTRERYRGTVFASYFLLYPVVRIIYEVFRQEPRIFLDLTQAQWAMVIYIVFAFICFLVIGYRYRKRSAGSPPAEETALKNNAMLKNMFSLAGLTASFMLLTFILYHLTRTLYVWPWPFSRVYSLGDAYARIIYYMPVMLVPVYSLFWLKRCNEPIRPYLKWNRFSWFFVAAMVASLYYTVDLLVFNNRGLHGLAFWPPVLILSAMNAFSEEVMYRLALYRFFRRAAYSKWVAIPLQALVYSIVHFMIAGAILGILSFGYGVILGLTADRSKSIVPGMVAHFIIDLAAIGAPILSL